MTLMGITFFNSFRWVAASILVCIFAVACAGPQVQMAIVQSPVIADALKLKRIAIGEFEGNPDEASAFANDVENVLASARIRGKPYFEIVSIAETSSALRAKGRSPKDLALPEVAKAVGSSLNADGVFLGNVVRSGTGESPYQESRSQCSQAQTLYNNNNQAVGQKCVRWSQYTVNCIKREASFEFAPRLIETATGRSIFSDTLKGYASDGGCSDGKAAQDVRSLLAQARQNVLNKIRAALAPVESHVAVEIMEAKSSSGFNKLSSELDQLLGRESDKTRQNELDPQFANGVEFAKAGRMDRACEIWKTIESVDSEHVPLLYNIGLCEESSGNVLKAQNYYTRADKLSTKPDKRITEALGRIGNQVSSKKTLTKARSDIFGAIPDTNAPPPLSGAFPTSPLNIHFKKGPLKPDDVAVIIGNADYGKLGKDIPNVKPAYADASSFKSYATQSLGIPEGNIIDLRDATGAQMNRVFGSRETPMGQLSDWAHDGRSNIFIYYAGHGAPGSNDGSAYLVPSDADVSRIEINGYPLGTLYANLSKLPAKSITVILEACFSGASQGGSVISNASPVYLKAITPNIPKNITVISAGASDQLASWEKDGSNGLFTKYFLKGMNGEADEKPNGNGDGQVSEAELGSYLKGTLTYNARRYYGRDQTAQIVRGKE